MILRLTGGKSLRTDRATAWAALHDVTCLQPCIRGCLSLQRVSGTRFELAVLVPVGPVSMAFSGSVTIEESVASRRLVLRARGAGGLAGLAEGTATLDLTDTPDGCLLAYTIAAEPSGPFAIAGTFLLAGLARSLVDDFGTRFAARVGRLVLVPPALRPDAPATRAAR